MVVKESAAEGEPRYSTVRMKLEGGQPWDHVSGLELTGGVSNYLRSSDVKDSLTGIPHYGRLTVGGVYEGVDLVFYSHDGAFEYDFVVKPGSDPKKIRLAFEGHQRMRVDSPSGDLVLTTAGGQELRQRRPNVYQQVGTKRVPGTRRVRTRRLRSAAAACYRSNRHFCTDLRQSGFRQCLRLGGGSKWANVRRWRDHGIRLSREQRLDISGTRGRVS